ncbi:MAG: AbrB family transcriptional regulator [Sulfitobacter sp.]
MRWPNLPLSPKDTAVTLVVGAIGAALAWALSMPVYMLLGPVIAVSLASLSGLRTTIDVRLRDACFVVIGIAVGAGFDSDALGAMLRWPLAFVFMALIIWLIMVLCQGLLSRFFGFDRRSALLASAPGHLSFVIAMATDTGSDVARISITQSVRLLALTLVVPFAAVAMGIELGGSIAPQGQAMDVVSVIGLIILSVALGFVFQRFAVPAPLLLGGMVASAMGHLTGIVPGVMPEWLILPAYLVLGALIGTRFSGVTPKRFVGGLAAGVTITLVAVGLAALGAAPVAWALGMPLAHVLVAFAPGGLETMIAMGAVLGVIPGFVAACHISRLLVLSVLLPWMLARLGKSQS